MRWSKHGKGEGPHGPGAGPHAGPRGYHHGNLKEALIRAALKLIAEKGPAGFTFAEAARWAGVSPAAPYRHFRDRDELLADVARRGFELFEAALRQPGTTAGPTPSPPSNVSAGPISNSRATSRAYYSAMFEAGVPLDANPELRAGRRPRLRGAAQRPPKRWSRPCRQTSGRRR